MKKRVMFALGLTAFLFVSMFMFFKRDTQTLEPEQHINLASEEGETRTNGDGEFFLPMSAEIK